MPALIYPLLLAMLLPIGGAAYWVLVAFNIVLVPLFDGLLRRFAPDWRPGARLLRFCFATPWFWIYAAVQWLVLLAALQRVATQPLSLFEFFGLVSSVGIMTGTAGITAAHELIHRRKRAERGLGLVLLAMASYQHFRIAHVYGHHRHVGTDADPASAALGESFPGFFAKGLWRGVRSAWGIAAMQRQRRGLRVYGIGNPMLQILLQHGAIYGAIALWFGPLVAVFYLLQSLMAVHLLEAVNYVQHYGLRRPVLQGRVAAVDATHAWDADDAVSGLLIFNLSHHALHHLKSGVNAAELPASEQAPRLPYSFFLMVFLALIPPLWHRVMDPRVPQVQRKLPQAAVSRRMLSAERI